MVIQLLVIVVLARLITPAEFGVMGAATVVIALSQIVSQVGVGPAIIQRREVTQAHIRTAVTLSGTLGFLLGAALSFVSSLLWPRVVDALTGASKPRSLGLWLLRFAVLIGAGYVIVKYLEVTPVAVFMGLLVSAAAVVISITYEVIFVRS